MTRQGAVCSRRRDAAARFYDGGMNRAGASAAEAHDGVGEPIDGDHLEPRDRRSRLVRARHDRLRETELRRFLQALLAARRGTHLAREPDLAEDDELGRE